MSKVDSDFLEKLKELEIAPSERANLLFQEKISSKKQQPNGAIRYFMMVASLLLVIGITIYFNQDGIDIGTDTALDVTGFTEQETEVDLEKSEPEKIEINDKNLAMAETGSSKFKEVKRVVNPIFEEEKVEQEITEEVEIEVLKRLRIETEFIELAQSPIIFSPEMDLSIKFVIPETTHPQMQFDFEIEERTLLAKLVDEMRFLIRGEDFDPDRSGIKPLFQEKSAIFVAETENLGLKITDLFN